MTTLQFVLCPKQTVVLVARTEPDITARATCTHERSLRLAHSSILLGEVRSLERRIAGDRRKLLELQPVYAARGYEGQQEKRGERRDNHGRDEE
jgi:hypothetical protein